MRSKALMTLCAAALTACGSSLYGPVMSPGGGGGGGHSTTITVGNDFFSPTPDTVTAGSLITWTWATPSNGHSVTWDSGPDSLPSNSGVMTSGSYSATLNTAGTWRYHCSVHGAAMSGVIVVQ